MNMKDFFKKYTKQNKKGFTIVEMLAVIIIISIASTATLSIFIAVQQTVKLTSEVTTQQFNTAQIERFLRNEFQTSSNIDVCTINEGIPDKGDAVKDDEFLYYDYSTQRLVFKTYSDAHSIQPKLEIDDVQEVSISICPTNYSVAGDAGTTVKNVPFKMIYKVQTSSVTYSGGIVLGNSYVNNKKCMSTYNSMVPDLIDEGYDNVQKNAITLHWYATFNDSGEPVSPDDSNNDFCIVFHSMSAEGTTSTP